MNGGIGKPYDKDLKSAAERYKSVTKADNTCDKTKAEDMKAHIILGHLYQNFEDGKSWDRALKAIEDYANQRVIEELEDMNLRLRCHPEIKGKSDIDIMFQRKLNELKKEI